MATCWEPGAPVQLSHSANPRRKLAWTLERVDMGAGWVGVNTARPNAVVAEGIEAGRIAPLAGYRGLRREVRFEPAGLPRGRIDMGLTDGPEPDALVEVKNVTLLEGGFLRFPDAVSERARKHLDLLLSAVRSGRRGVILFAANRPEGERVGPAWNLDPAYARRLVEAVEGGVEALAVRLVHSATGIETGEALPVDLGRAVS
jgi:sugar fermentation stimulation protein A